MAYRVDQPKKTPPPVRRLDTATANRLRTAAQDYLAKSQYDLRLDAADRTLMQGEICAQIPAGGALPDLSGKSDTYLAARYNACLERVRADAADPLVPADGVVSAGMRSEMNGSAKEQRKRMNAYLSTAFTQLLAEQGHMSTPNGCDVEDRARQLAKLDPKGLFTDGQTV